MSKLRLEYWPVGRFRPYGRKLKKREKAVEQMVESIREFGFRVPVLAMASGEVLDGELRLLAGLRMGMEELPVVPADGLTPEQVRAFRLMANRSAAWAEWDVPELALELADLQALDIDLALTGFPVAELNEILRALDGQADPDSVPETPAVPVARPGDVWALGGHRLLCGDSTRPGDLARLMAGELAAMVFTDPPYNVDYEGAAGKIANDKMGDKAFLAFLMDAFTATRGVLAEGGPAYVAHADTEGLNFRLAFREAGFKLAACLVWRKSHMVLGRSDYQWQHEPILYGWNPGAAHRWYGGRTRTTVLEPEAFPATVREVDGGWLVQVGDVTLHLEGGGLVLREVEGTVVCVDKPVANVDHPTMKPVALVERFLKNSSAPGAVVLDPFGGSGTTLIACERLARKCRMVELDPRFCDVIVRRWEEYTGRKAEVER